MLDLQIAEFSSTAGVASDGIVRGAVLQSSLIGAFNNTLVAPNIYAVRRDAGSGFNFVDVSTQAVSEVDNSFEPWGTTATLSADDSLYIACDDDPVELYFQITTSGVWSGDDIDIYDSTDGKTANRLLTGIVDGTNGFRAAAGVYRVSFDQPATARLAFSPVPSDIAERRWLVIKPKNLTAATTAPKLRRMWIIHDSPFITYNDFTTIANASLTDGDFSSSPSSVFYTAGHEKLYVFPFLAYRLDHEIHRRIPNIMTRVFEYLATDDTWKSLLGWSDPSNDFKNGPANLGDPTQAFSIRWTIPSDWTEKTQTLPLTGGGSQAVTGYFIRYRVTSMNTFGPVAPPLARSRVRAFGVTNSSGIYHRNATVYRAVTFDIGVPSTTDTQIQLVNINTGQGTSFDIPANTRSSSELASERIDLSPELNLQAGHSFLVSYSSGGTLQDIELRLQQ